MLKSEQLTGHQGGCPFYETPWGQLNPCTCGFLRQERDEFREALLVEREKAKELVEALEVQTRTEEEFIQKVRKALGKFRGEGKP